MLDFYKIESVSLHLASLPIRLPEPLGYTLEPLGLRARQLDLFQEHRECRDLVGFLLRRDLSQGVPLLTGPGADDVQRAEPVRGVVGPPTRLAVDRHQPVWAAVVGPDGVGDPVLEA